MPRIRKLCKETPQIVHAYSQGTTLRKLADFFEVSTGTIRNILRREGVQLRSRGRKKEENDA